MTPLRTGEVIAYLILQYVLWFLLVWGAAAGHLWWPSAVTAAILFAACWRGGSNGWRIAAVTAVGILCAVAVDGSLLKIGAVTYAGSDALHPLPPLWIITLWALFAATIALPARNLLTNPIVAGVLGGVGGPLAYAGGRALGALSLSNQGLIVVGVFFALATPVIVLIANRLLPPVRVERIR